MNFNKILNEIEQADPAVYEEVNGRREVLKSFGSKVAVAALPFAIGSLFQKASAKTTALDTLVEVFNFALEMEFFAYNFYHTANNTGALIPALDQPGYVTIENQKKAHILYLQGVVTSLGGTPYVPYNYNAGATNPLYIVEGTYDFTSYGKYAPFSHYPTFVMLAEVFEDTFVRGYKGEIPAVLSNVNALEQVMRLQSVTGRHAAHVRLVKRRMGYALAPEHPTPWITNAIPPAENFQPYYNGEEMIGQQNIDLTALPGIDGTTPATAATAAFDEPLDKGYVLSFLAPFKLA